MDDKRALLRHVLGTIAYRGGKTLRDAPPGFASFKAGETTRSPGRDSRAHRRPVRVGPLGREGRAAVEGVPAARVGRRSAAVFRHARRLDAYLASDAPLGAPAEQLFQGPLADALTHVGQLALLRRLAGASVKAENYFKADITAGRVGTSQAPPRREF